jgi:hypothetical protein
MKIEIKIEKDGHEGKDMPESEMGGEMELTPEQIADMAKKLKAGSALSRADRTMLANYLLKESED